MFPSYYEAQQMFEERVRDEQREIAQWRLARDAGRSRRGPITRGACRLICGLGIALVRAGQALQQRVAADAAYGGATRARLAS